jgi:hypothetical protein
LRDAAPFTDARRLDHAAELFDDVRPALKLLVSRHAEQLTAALAGELEAEGMRQREAELERYRSRSAEILSLINENSLAKLEREIAKLKQLRDQGALFDEESRLEDLARSIEEKQAEIERRRRNYEEVREQLERERERITKHLLPKRYALAGEAQCSPSASRYAFLSREAPDDCRTALPHWLSRSRSPCHHPRLGPPAPGGLLLDPPRLRRIAEHVPVSLDEYTERELRKRFTALADDGAPTSDVIAYVLEHACGFIPREGAQWLRGPAVPAEHGRRAITGETIKPRHLWLAENGGMLPVFIDTEKRIGVGRGRRATSHVVQWLRSSGHRLALLTNGRQWRLIFAGLDFDAFAEADADLFFEEGGPAPQLEALARSCSRALDPASTRYACAARAGHPRRPQGSG